MKCVKSATIEDDCHYKLDITESNAVTTTIAITG
jgi:hypothetical protein